MVAQEKGQVVTLKRTQTSMRKIRPIEKPRWDEGVGFAHVLLDGELPPVPEASRGSDPNNIWPQVEGRLGYGIGTRRCRFLMVTAGTRWKSWTPPAWWIVEDVQQALQTFDQITLKPLEWQWKEATPRDDGSYTLAKGRAFRFTVRIDGRPAGMNEGVAYYLEAIR